MLNHIIESKRLAEASVNEGDETLKKANNTYHLLQSFQSEVEKSSENAKIALQDVPAIRQQLIDTEDIIRKAEEVSLNSENRFVFYLFRFVFFSQALEESYNNAEKAKSNAQDAQERYADQASKVFFMFIFF
jgi:laminin, gamma 1